MSGKATGPGRAEGGRGPFGGLAWPGRRGRAAPWSARTDSAKVELYTRYTFHAMAGLEVGGFALPQLIGERQPTGAWLFPLFLVHAVLCSVVASRALDWRQGRRARPVTLMVTLAALSGAMLLLLLLLLDTGGFPERSDFGLLLLGISAFGLGTLSLGLSTTKQRVQLVLGAATAGAVATAVLDMGGRQIWLDFVGITAAGSLFVVTYVFSAWLLSVVSELNATQELKTRLAVAEERLRFGRDIHDVMGRNLAVMALKSELAVQLAERGRPEAVVQMAEVQRIAQESQREIREVVRGYREADLRTEMEGALSVLKAAGITCVIHGLDGEAVRTLPPDIQSALGWVVREATTNVLRHGDPRRCTIRISTAEGTGGGSGPGAPRRAQVILTVRNDGAPAPAGARNEAGREAAGKAGSDGETDPGSPPGPLPGSGLAGLRERLAAHDGTLEAGPAPGDGTFQLTARVPLPPPGPDDESHDDTDDLLDTTENEAA